MGCGKEFDLSLHGPQQRARFQRFTQPLTTLQVTQHALGQVQGGRGVGGPLQLLARLRQLLERVPQMQEVRVSLAHRSSPCGPVSRSRFVRVSEQPPCQFAVRKRGSRGSAFPTRESELRGRWAALKGVARFAKSTIPRG